MVLYTADRICKGGRLTDWEASASSFVSHLLEEHLCVGPQILRRQVDDVLQMRAAIIHKKQT